MTFDIQRLLGLIEQKISPANGMEAHFLRVSKGEALPVSPVEREWWEAVLNHRRNSTAGGNAPNDEERNSRATAQTDRLIQPQSELVTENERLSEEIAKRVSENAALMITIAEKEEALIQMRVENSALKASQASNDERLNALENEFEQVVSSRVDLEVFEIKKSNDIYRSANASLASRVESLISQLKRFIPPRAKCKHCDGVGTWYDKSTYRAGADWEGSQVRDVCSACNGAGYVANPDRASLE